MLYHHYKKKPYLYIGTATHSETYEEMAIYKPLYDNPKGKLWVRPKAMFDETVEVDGKTVPRFKHIPVELKESSNIDEQIPTLAPLIEKIFGQWDSKWFNKTREQHSKFHIIIAYLEDKPVGFKLGYERNENEFYSWLGGVLAEARGLGIASTLMTHQHGWCKQHGYKKIRTKTQNRFRPMFILNLKHGFDVIGTQETEEGFKIVLEKSLA